MVRNIYLIHYIPHPSSYISSHLTILAISLLYNIYYIISYTLLLCIPINPYSYHLIHDSCMLIIRNSLIILYCHSFNSSYIIFLYSIILMYLFLLIINLFYFLYFIVHIIIYNDNLFSFILTF